MAYVRNFRDGSLTLQDGTTPTPNSVAVTLAQGNLSISGLGEGQAEVKDYQTRGAIVSVRKGEYRPVTFTFDFMVEDYTDPSTPTVADAILKDGAASGWASTIDATTTPPGDVYALDVVFVVAGETITLSKCVMTLDLAEGDPNTGSVSGTCYGGVTIS